MDNFFSVLFKIILVLFGFVVIYKVVLYIVIGKLMKQILVASKEEKAKIVNSFSRVLAVYKILFWMSPLTLIFFPASVYLYLNSSFFYALGIIVILYVMVLEDFFYRRSIVRRIGINI